MLTADQVAVCKTKQRNVDVRRKHDNNQNEKKEAKQKANQTQNNVTNHQAVEVEQNQAKDLFRIQMKKMVIQIMILIKR